MEHVYVVVNKSMMMLGIFTTWENLQMAMAALKESGESKAYYAKVEVDTFDKLLPNFWTMHYEKLEEVVF